MAALRRQPPELIFTGYAPFRASRAFLNEHYLASRMVPGLWIKGDALGDSRLRRSTSISGSVHRTRLALARAGVLVDHDPRIDFASRP